MGVYCTVFYLYGWCLTEKQTQTVSSIQVKIIIIFLMFSHLYPPSFFMMFHFKDSYCTSGIIKLLLTMLSDVILMYCRLK